MYLYSVIYKITYKNLYNYFQKTLDIIYNMIYNDYSIKEQIKFKYKEDKIMTGTIKINGTYGAKVGNLQVFTYEGAANAYRKICEIFNRDLSMEASAIQSEASLDMNRLGFSWEEIEAIELSTM